MTNEEIKKALKICGATFPCEGCPYDDNFGKCVVKLKEDARELIIKQEQEIAQLRAENARLTAKLGQVLLAVDTVKEMNTMCNVEEQVKQAKIEVLNKLKDYVNQLACDEYGDSACDTNYITIDIDKYEQDIDEMIEELTKCRR